MADTLTKLADLVNPQVLAPIVSYEFKNAMRFTPLASIDNTLQGTAGNTLTFPAFTYIGDAQDVAEGAPIPLDKLGTSTTSATVKKAAKGTEITDEAVLSGYGDPVGESTKQLGLSIANKVDNDILAAAFTATQSVDFAATSDMVQSALTVFATNSDDDDSPVVAVMSPADAAALRKAARNEGTGSEVSANALVNGTKFEVLGVQIIESNKVTAGQAIFIKVNATSPAIKLIMKKSASVETDRNIITKTTVLTADEHYVAYLYDPTKVVVAKKAEA
ncbi:N4-gp56 family major capsid protein [Weissella paramesenteroides]|uniref:N4-gp56 family major capsid protein n=1 Tax=Weissella paramesenteroides TaxID=1249 RepID=UPI003F24662C